MKGFIFVHDKNWKDRLTAVKVKAITSIAETLDHNAIIAYGDDIVIETGESFIAILRDVKREMIND